MPTVSPGLRYGGNIICAAGGMLSGMENAFWAKIVPAVNGTKDRKNPLRFISNSLMVQITTVISAAGKGNRVFL